MKGKGALMALVRMGGQLEEGRPRGSPTVGKL